METAAIGLRREFKMNNSENMCIYSICIFLYLCDVRARNMALREIRCPVKMTKIFQLHPLATVVRFSALSTCVPAIPEVGRYRYIYCGHVLRPFHYYYYYYYRWSPDNTRDAGNSEKLGGVAITGCHKREKEPSSIYCVTIRLYCITIVYINKK